MTTNKAVCEHVGLGVSAMFAYSFLDVHVFVCLNVLSFSVRFRSYRHINDPKSSLGNLLPPNVNINSSSLIPLIS